MSKNIILFVILQLLICGWSSEKVLSKHKDVYSIYLVKNSKLTYATKKPELKDFILQDIPLLTVDSITSYTWHSHLISFSISVKKGLRNQEPLIDRLFVVVANDERIYWGMFTDFVDSYISNSPAIFLLPRDHPWSSTSASRIPDGFSISRGPIVGKDSIDVRNDIRIYNALNASGKLLP